MSSLPYSSPPQPRPRVITWFYIYCIAYALLPFLIFIAGVVILVIGPLGDGPVTGPPPKIVGAIISCITFPFLLVPVIPFLTSTRRRWRYIYDLIFLGLGLTNVITLPAAIPLLIFYLKPEVKAFYGGSSVGPQLPPHSANP